MNTKRYLALVMALVMAFSLVVPVSAAPSVGLLDQSGTDTARLTVYVENEPAAVGSIDSDMKATLKLNYGSYAADSEVTVAGQTKSHANQTTFTLKGSTSSGIDLTTEGKIYTYFPGFNLLNNPNGYAIQFFDELVTPSQKWDYIFKKSADTSGVTLEVVESDDDTTDEVDGYWQTLKKEAFEETRGNTEDSFIKLTAGSYLQMANEKLTVNSDLLLDDFSTSDSVDENVTNAEASLAYSGSESVYAYQLLLKAGTQFSLGCSRAVVKQDLLVTMSNVTKSYDESILNNVYSNLNTSKEKQLAESLLEVFSEIAGLARPGDTTKPVVITFGRPATEVAISDPEEVNNGDGTTTTTSTAIAVDTTGTTTTYNIKTTTTTTTETSSGNESTTTITTKPVPVDTATAAEVDNEVKVATATNAVAASAVAAVTAYNKNNDSATFKAALASNDSEPTAAKVLQTTAAAKAIATAAAQEGVTVSEITKAEVILKTELKAVDTTNETPIVTYDIKPVAQLYKTVNNTLTAVGAPVELNNGDIAVGETFTFNIPVPAAMADPGDKVKVTHRSAGYDPEVSTVTVDNDNTVTITVTHFSEFDLEPVEVAETGTAKLFYNLTLSDTIAINVKVKQLTLGAEHYTVKYSYNGENEKSVSLNTVTPVEEDSANVYPIMVAECAAKEMVDTVSVKLYCDGVQCGDTKVLSIRGYCESVISGASTDAKLIALCKAVLNYGASAQNYFHYETTSLANAGISTGNIPNVVPEFSVSTDNGAHSIRHNANLSLESKTELNFKLKDLDTTSLSIISVEDITAEPSESWQFIESSTNDSCTVKVTGIPAKHLDHVFKLTYTYGGTTYSIMYSPLAYAHAGSVYQGNANLSKICRALYGYWLAAKEYLPNN